MSAGHSTPPVCSTATDPVSAEVERLRAEHDAALAAYAVANDACLQASLAAHSVLTALAAPDLHTVGALAALAAYTAYDVSLTALATAQATLDAAQAALDAAPSGESQPDE